MECPHCRQKISGKECPSCGMEIPSESHYCMKCGAELKVEDATVKDEDEFDLDSRVLCPDGSCTGIIIGGKCIECGKPYRGKE